MKISKIKDHLNTIHNKTLHTTMVYRKELDKSVEETNEEWVEIKESTYDITRVNNHENKQTLILIIWKKARKNLPHSSDNEYSIFLTPPPKYKALKRSEYPIGCSNCEVWFMYEVLLIVHTMMSFCHQYQPEKSPLKT